MRLLKKLFYLYLFIFSSIDVLADVHLDNVDTTLSLVSTKHHPRSIDVSKFAESANSFDMVFKRLHKKIIKYSTMKLPNEPISTSALKGTSKVYSANRIRKIVFSEEKTTISAAISWLSTRDYLALNEAKRRALNLSGWRTDGATSFISHDQAGRSIAWTLSLLYDWLYKEFTVEQRQSIKRAIKTRVVEMLSNDSPYGLDNLRRLDKNPYNSHGAILLARLSVICSIMAGEDPLFDSCFKMVVPKYLSRPIPWGGHDGGFSNGTNYAQWDVSNTNFLVWTLLKQTIGKDLWKESWAKGYGLYITYFLPPNTPSGMFGDGAEKYYPGVLATQSKVYASNISSPLFDWYASQWENAELSSPAFLLAPMSLRAKNQRNKSFPSGVPDSLHIKSIGWVAMHSSLNDQDRTSIYFKSSPYGSYNHSHADQNGFVINARGKRMLIDSGYYDYYTSPHRLNWYRQTRAHNAITFDGGQGQYQDSLDAKGRIALYKSTKEYNIVTGDALLAYGEDLTKSIRSLVYIPPHTLLVYDSLSSDIPRTWEWNVHTENKMLAYNEESIEVQNQGVRLCIDMVYAPDVSFRQTNDFTVNPKGNYKKQWHGVFETKSKSMNASFLTKISVGCEAEDMSISTENENLTITSELYNFTFSTTSGALVDK